MNMGSLARDPREAAGAKDDGTSAKQKCQLSLAPYGIVQISNWTVPGLARALCPSVEQSSNVHCRAPVQPPLTVLLNSNRTYREAE